GVASAARSLGRCNVLRSWNRWDFLEFAPVFGDGGLGHKRTCGVNGLGPHNSSFRDAPPGADPESIHQHDARPDGFRARSPHAKLAEANFVAGSRPGMTKDTTPHSRGAESSGLCQSPPSKRRGCRERRVHERTHCLACKTKRTHAGQHRYAEITPAFPAQWL